MSPALDTQGHGCECMHELESSLQGKSASFFISLDQRHCLRASSNKLFCAMDCKLQVYRKMFTSKMQKSFSLPLEHLDCFSRVLLLDVRLEPFEDGKKESWALFLFLKWRLLAEKLDFKTLNYQNFS